MKGTGEVENKDIIRVVDIIGQRFCISMDDGDKILIKIKEHFEAGKEITISFAEITDLTSAFLCAAFSPLFNGEFTEEDIKTKLKIVDINDDDLFCVTRSFDRARKYYKDPEAYKEAVRKVLGDDIEY